MATTDHHAKLWAHLLSVAGSAGSHDRLARALDGARVDLNPHQVDAALFALASPLRRGALLADEVGLGKTIEAGIVLAQRWAERRRRVLLVVPATLRKQWQSELEEKFGFPTRILEAAALRGQPEHANPFDSDGTVLICSYAFAARHADRVRRVPWDVVVVDEAHRLRNVYKAPNGQAAAIRDATAHAFKLLLTATPLQNSLLELYGLASVLDPHAFGDLASFRDQFVNAPNTADRDAYLRRRLAPFCTRTLRSQVREYVRFTQRLPLTQSFSPSDSEQTLYDAVSDFLQRPALASIPNAQRALITLVLRKLLASSSFAIAHTLTRLAGRIDALARGQTPADVREAAADLDALDELEDEWTGDGAETDAEPIDIAAERAELHRLAALAHGVSDNAKGHALLAALPVALDQAAALGAARKAVVFTESRRTQKYLFDLLYRSGYAGEVVCISGNTSDPRARPVYEAWRARNPDRLSGSRASDLKAALVEEFRDNATVLLATEAAAEGVNLQFCSLVVNYDLPWNPQRVEQRIGRCHRYGQKHDVVVVNFLNERNAAEARVFELLAEKFKLFSGVFGASDEVLGALESGLDVERRIAEVYQACRTADEIQGAFDALQAELSEQIAARMDGTRKALLDKVDEDVHARLQVHHDRAQEALSERGRLLFALARHELDGAAAFVPDAPRFEYRGPLGPPGRYTLDWREAARPAARLLSTDSGLGHALLTRAAGRTLPPVSLRLDLTGHPTRVASLAPLAGQSGTLTAARLQITGLSTDEHVLLAGQTDGGQPLDEAQALKLFSLRATPTPLGQTPAPLDGPLAVLVQGRLAAVDARDAAALDEQAATLDAWADDLKVGLERELRALDRTLKEAQRAARAAVSLPDKLAAQREVRSVERERDAKRRALYDAQDKIDDRRSALISDLEAGLDRHHAVEPLFTLHWALA